MNFQKFAPGDHWLQLSLGRDRRKFRLHIPTNLDATLCPVIAFDGVTVRNPEGSMGGINGLDIASEKYRFAAIYPVPNTRYFGVLAGWNTPGGYLSFYPEFDDVDFVREIFLEVHVERAYAIGFSAGAQFAHILAGRLPGRIAGVGSVCGTWLGTEPPPPGGTALVVIHGEEDPVQPYRGGTSRMMRVRIAVALGNRNILLSRPDHQAPAYAAANGYGPAPEIEETEVYFKRTFGPGAVPVVEYLIRHPYGGHTYHGRHTGEGTESLLSKDQGRPLAPGTFSANDVFAATMGFARDRIENRSPPDNASSLNSSAWRGLGILEHLPKSIESDGTRRQPAGGPHPMAADH